MSDSSQGLLYKKLLRLPSHSLSPLGTLLGYSKLNQTEDVSVWVLEVKPFCFWDHCLILSLFFGPFFFVFVLFSEEWLFTKNTVNTFWILFCAPTSKDLTSTRRLNFEKKQVALMQSIPDCCHSWWHNAFPVPFTCILFIWGIYFV